jgi:CrcB protein
LLKKSLSVALFGAIGGILRYLLQIKLDTVSPSFPVSLVAINVLGAFLLGILSGGLLILLSTSDVLNVGLTTGLMGGFTTFSTFELALLNQLKNGHGFAALFFLVSSVVLSVVMANLGQQLGASLLKHKRKDW